VVAAYVHLQPTCLDPHGPAIQATAPRLPYHSQRHEVGSAILLTERSAMINQVPLMHSTPHQLCIALRHSILCTMPGAY
jgi:hypothetical protein